MARRNIGFFPVLVILVLIAGVAAAGYYFTRPEEEQKKLLEATQAEGRKLKAKANRAADDVGDAAEKVADADISIEAPEYHGHDARSFNKGGDMMEEQTERVTDLQKRLDSAYDR